FRIRQEFEQYHDDQSTIFTEGDDPSTIHQKFEDDPGYTNWRTMLMFDSFLDEETYVTANYMYNYLNSNSTRNASANSDPRQSLAQAFTNNSAGSSRRTNVGTFGYHKANIYPDLHLSAGVRVEDMRTQSQSSGLLGGTPRELTSRRDEVRIAEMVRLIYVGVERTTLSFDADLEQRDMGWEENNDGSRWKADVDFTDQVYEVKAVHRSNGGAKYTCRFRVKNIERSYTDLFDDDMIAYPGYIDGYRKTGNDLMLKTDWRLDNTTSASLMYQLLQESIDTSVGGKTQNLEIHRGSGSLSVNPTTNLFMVGTFMLENYRLDTPATGGPGFIADGSRPFDYRGNSFSLLLDGNYAFNEKTSCVFGFRHTEALGTVDYAGDYAYDSVGLTVKHKIADNRAIGAGYRFINYNNHDGGNFDDYDAHGALYLHIYVLRIACREHLSKGRSTAWAVLRLFYYHPQDILIGLVETAGRSGIWQGDEK
ncbi:MAG: hypothetical protein KAJ19_28565, partial [Gammaproteobacteria bacterium]|nr:hypothetical protein [Gammaproteobacteria bacterium]